MSDAYEKIVICIVNQQEQVIGQVAVEKAKQVSGIILDWEQKSAHINGEPTEIINNLVRKYSELFGELSVEVCKEASASIVSHLQKHEIPSVLR